MNKYKMCTSISEISKHLSGKKEVAFDFETSPINPYRNEELSSLDPHKSSITGVSLSVEEGTGIYIPLRHRRGVNSDTEEIMNYLKNELFLNSNITKIAHNLAFEARFLYKYGIIIQEPVYDTIAASQLTLKSKDEYRKLYDSGLKTLAKELLGEELPTFKKVVQGRHFDELDSEDYETIRYGCSDSDYALRLYNLFNEWFRKYIPNHEFIVRKVESPSSVFVGLMKYNGIDIDKGLIHEKHLKAKERILYLKNKINTLAGRKINIGANASTDEFKRFLYDENGLPILKITAGFKEGLHEEALVLLKDWCSSNKPDFVELLDTVQEYRKVSKIKSTYIDGMISCINNATGRVHGDFFPLGTDTGRFSSKNPNLQNLPRKDNDPIGVRNFLVAREGYEFVSYDFSQIELRVGAYYCRDERMLNTYRNRGDIHGETTSVIYGIPFEKATDKNAMYYKERRSIAKNCNFGVFYGLFPKGLQKNLKVKAGMNITLERCEDIIENIKRGYPKLVKWQRETIRKARVKRYSETALGRRRYLRDINSKSWGIKAYWERCALNTPIQGTAADILKLCLGNIIMILGKYPYIRPVLQIHDEVMFEVPCHKLEEATAVIKECMERVPFEGFDVPIVAEGAIGKRFGGMEDLPSANLGEEAGVMGEDLAL